MNKDGCTPYSDTRGSFELRAPNAMGGDVHLFSIDSGQLPVSKSIPAGTYTVQDAKIWCISNPSSYISAVVREDTLGGVFDNGSQITLENNQTYQFNIE